MKATFKLTLILAVIVPLNIESKEQNEKCDIDGEVVFYESAADAKYWKATLDVFGFVSVEYNENLLNYEKKNIKKSKTLDKEQVRKLCSIFAESSFFSLPEYIGEDDAPLHAPSFEFDLSINGIVHRTELYYPAGVENQKNTKIFVKLWEVFGNAMPIKPPSPKEYMSGFNKAIILTR